MANSAKVSTGNLPRLLQYGLDSQIEHLRKDYPGVGKLIFKEIAHEKGYYEAMEYAGMGPAAVKGEGEPVQVDSIDQFWVYRWPVITYSKAARVTMEAIADNVYEDILPILAQQVAHGLDLTKDILQANVLNNLSSTAGPDGVNVASTAHPLQAGGTTSNLLSPGVSFGEDAIEQMAIAIRKEKNPNGQFADLNSRDLIIPVDLWFEADRVANSRFRVNTPDNTISAIYNQNIIQRVIPWTRLTSATAFFITTDAMKGFECIQREGKKSDSFKEPTTMDIIVTNYERYVNIIEDFRGVFYNAGA